MTIPETIAQAKELSAEKATEYLAVGGLFNPELMKHDKVRDMVMAFHTLLPAMANALESEHNRANNAEAEVERLTLAAKTEFNQKVRLLSEVERLRKMVAEADHSQDCPKFWKAGKLAKEVHCTCFKSRLHLSE